MDLVAKTTDVFHTALDAVPNLETFVNDLASNQVFLGFFALAVLGAVSYAVRLVFTRVYNILKRQFTVQMKVKNANLSFDFLIAVLYEHGIHIKTRIVEAQAEYGEKTRFYPGDGTFFIFLHGRFYLLSKETSEGKMSRPPESFLLQTYGRSVKPFEALLEEGQKLFTQDSDGLLQLREWSDGWEGTRKLPRRMETVILEEDKKADIIKDLRWFCDNQEWYQEKGIPYHRGYMLYGPPGTGKTSLIMALAFYFNRPLCTINISSVSSDKELIEALRSTPKESIVLFEDIDSCKSIWARDSDLVATTEKPNEVQPDKDDDEEDLEDSDDDKDSGGTTIRVEGSSVSTTGMLNALDGAGSQDGQIIFVTTNRPDVFDEAFMRPGRIDRRFFIGYPHLPEIERMYYRFFPDAKEAEAKEFAEENLGSSPATLQGELMQKVFNQ